MSNNNFIFEAAFNALSFGNVSFGLSYEFYKRGLNPVIFPIANNADLGAYDKVEDDYKQYIKKNIESAFLRVDKNLPYLKSWHINGGWHRIGSPAYFLTFYELDSLTDAEIRILNLYDKIFVPSTCSKKVFESYGVKPPVVYCPMGVDTVQFGPTKREYLTDGTITFSIFGKYEKRKGHAQAIRAWVKRFGVKQTGERLKYRLNLYIHNPFYDNSRPELTMNNVYAYIFENKPQPPNVTIFSFQPLNSIVNDMLNQADVIIDMSGGESISLPTLNAIALGKHAVVLNCSAMSDYIKNENAVLVNPNGKIPAYDGVFFVEGQPFSQGNIFTFKDEDFIEACEKAIDRFISNPINEAGKKLVDTHSYSKGVDTILKEMDLVS